MKTQLASAVAAISLLVAGPACAADKAAIPDAWTETLTAPAEKFLSTGRNDYFILEPGYRLVLEGKEDGKKATLTVAVLAETKRVGEVETRIVEEREVIGGQLVEVSRNFLAIGAASKHVYYFGEEVDMYKDGKIVSHEGAWLAGTNGAKHGILVPGQIKVGDRYYQEQAPKVAMGRAENVSTEAVVKTPAGRFERCLKTRETTPLEAGTEFKFYAPGVGLIQDGDLKLIKSGVAKP
jgi:hypothetical protein